MDGWIKLHRKTLDNPIVCKDSDHLAVWMYLLMNATHKEYPAIFAGEKIMLQPGQLITGRISISEKLNIHESKVQRILKSFEIEQQIEQQKSNKNRLISILSWSEYQTDEQQNEHLVNNKRTTTEQQVNTNKNVKNVKNVQEQKKKDKTAFEDYTSNPILIKTLDSFLEHRKKIKKAMTDGAIKLLLNKLDKLASNDDDKIAILEQSIFNGWQGIFELKGRSSGYQQFNKPIKPQISVVEKSTEGTVSDEEFEEMLRLAEDMQKNKGGGRND